jgi:protocatechuate 3,4-dioxygenase beta subunit
MQDDDEGTTRRSLFRNTGAAGLGLVLMGGGAALTGGEPALAAASCTLTAEQEEGPYYLDLEKIRRDIREDISGILLDLRIAIVDSSSCEPIEDVAVDIWHANPAGHYSGFAGEGTSGDTFLRGVQLTSSSGVARFLTVYPGWYQGRALHIHVKAHVGGKASGRNYKGGHVAHTGQVFFKESVTAAVGKLSPYKSNSTVRTKNSGDRVYTEQGGGMVSAKKRSSANIRKGFVGTVTLALDPDATPSGVG